MQAALRATLSSAFRSSASLSASTSANSETAAVTTRSMRKQVPVPSGPFPSSGLLPKDETQAASFIKRFPEYDGRGIRVAVLDTGVDPASFGLGGKGKVVDIIDCTGAGDIALKPVEPLASGAKDTEQGIRLPGLSGRTLLLSNEWKNPKGTWRVGMKRAFELWPGDLIGRRKRERKQERDRKIGELLSLAKKNLAEFEAKKGKDAAVKRPIELAATKSEATKVATGSEDKKAEPSSEEKTKEKLQKQELEARLTYLSDLDIEDPGPILDVVVWHDGTDWRCVVSGAEGQGVDEDIAPLPTEPKSGEEGEKRVLDLRKQKPMADYVKEHHYERFGTQDLLSYSAKFYDDGEILSICCVSGTHGSHVASIIGAHVPEQPELNGVAPGIEIVSLTIGDNRLSALETHQALMRATKAILDTECDICNMSFGEDAAWGTENRGQFLSMLRDEVVKKRNVIFVGAAGNSGPALSTIGAPMTTSGIITVGAYETPSMQISEYAMLDTVPAGPYTWSSRGPTYDGSHVTIWAPGGAVAGTNAYALQHSQLFNGTSMASPNACGAISLVLSALKAEGISWTPARVHHALRATSKDVDDPQPVGLIQVEALHKYLVDRKDRFECDADFDVHITPPGRAAPDFSKSLSEREGLRGVYLREKEETSRLYEASCHVRPSFSTNMETEKLLALDLKLALAASEPWVKVPNFVSLPSNGRAFDIRVDPTSLAPGVHYAEIRAFDTSAAGRVVFTVPVCVCKPESSSASMYLKEVKTSPGFIERKFISVPEGATWAEMRISARNNATPAQLWIQCIQLQPEVRLSHVDNQFILNATQGETVSKRFSVVGGVTMEVCISQFWKSLPHADVSIELHFHGLTLDTGKSLTIVGGGAYPRLQVTSKVRFEQFSPSVSFDRRRAMLRPSDSKITPLGSRDVMPDGKRLYQLVNTYSFRLSEKTKIKPFFATSDNLYDNPFAILTQIKDSRGYVVQWGSVYPKEAELGKGDYTLLLQIEHSDYKVLKKNMSLTMGLEAQLGEKSKKLSLTVHRDHIDASTKSESNPFKNIKMQLGETRPLVIATDLNGDTSELYKAAKAGDLLFGQLKLGGSTAKADFALAYVLPPQAKSDDSDDNAEEEPLLVDLQLGLLDKIKDDKARKAFLDTLLSENSTHLPALVAALKALKLEEADPKDVSKAADAVLAQIDEHALAVHLGKKPAPTAEQTEEQKKENKAMDEKKKAWATAYSRKIEASYNNNEDLQEQEKLFAKYRQFVDSPDKDQDFSLISAKRDFAQKRFGSCLATVKKLLEDSLSKEKYKEVTDLERKCLTQLGYVPLLEYKARWKLVKEPSGEAIW